jgi:hypothetical protein
MRLTAVLLLAQLLASSVLQEYVCGSAAVLVAALQLKSCTSTSISRRSILSSAATTATAATCVAGILLPTRASATAAGAMDMEQQYQQRKQAVAVAKKPFAPVENLVPAIRVKQTIDQAVTLTKSLHSSASSSSSSKSKLQELEKLLLQPQNYVPNDLKLPGVPAKPADLYLKSYQPMAGDLPFQRYLIQNGDVATWKRLKQREKQLEQSSQVRAALNAYTNALEFSGDSYLLNVDAATRSSMVRQDRLPKVTQVITSDMGLRYLYRNQVLTAMDDVKAELEYQLSIFQKEEEKRNGIAEDATTTTTTTSIDTSELLNLLLLANDAMDRWLSLIDAKDVQEAVGMAAVVGQ